MEFTKRKIPKKRRLNARKKERKKEEMPTGHTYTRLCANNNSHIIIIMRVEIGGSRSFLAKLATIRCGYKRHTDLYSNSNSNERPTHLMAIHRLNL